MHFGEDAAENVLAYLEDLEAQMLAGDQRKEIIQRYPHVEHLTREMVEFLKEAKPSNYFELLGFAFY